MKIILVLVLLVAAVFAGMQIGEKRLSPGFEDKAAPAASAAAQKIKASANPSVLNETIEWKTARYGNYTYEYPAGWHVAELWGIYQDIKVLIAIHPNPISTAPRGGPLSAFMIGIYQGNQDPEAILAKQINKFNPENYTDIKHETLTTENGDVEHFTAKINGEMSRGESDESYIFMLIPNPNDKINQLVIEANMSIIQDPQYSQMLRHIVLSFKKATP